MATEVAKVMPEFTTLVDFNKPDMHYIKTFRVKEGDKFVSRGTNLYWPEPKNDKFDYNPADTIYQCRREELNGTHGDGEQKKFLQHWDAGVTEFEQIKTRHEAWKKEGGM
jgi:hypothetical protein